MRSRRYRCLGARCITRAPKLRGNNKNGRRRLRRLRQRSLPRGEGRHPLLQVASPRRRVPAKRGLQSDVCIAWLKLLSCAGKVDEARKTDHIRRHRRLRKEHADAIARTISDGARSEEHTSELQSREHFVCRL